MSARKICVVTGSRAEYGLLKSLINEVHQNDGLLLQLIVTGAHLAPEFGLTYREIEKDGFQIDAKIEMLLSSDTPLGMAKSLGLGTIGFADAFDKLKPDLLVVLGDRFEILAAVSAALPRLMPAAHIHGGEVTTGAIDDAMRHSITKMSHLHFVAAKEYRNRVIQLGEAPENVFEVGGLGVDNLTNTNLFERNALEEKLDVEFGTKSLLVTFHPATIEAPSSEAQTRELLAALDLLEDTTLIFTAANADTEGRIINGLVKEFTTQKKRRYFFNSLGQQCYWSCISQVDGVVGNSSSGLLEAPTLKTGTIDIGERQTGRLLASSVIRCDPTRESIRLALDRLYGCDFQRGLSEVVNPYGDGGATQRIIKEIGQADLESIVKKKFFDLG